MDATVVQNGLERKGFKLFEQVDTNGIFVKSYQGYGQRDLMRYLRSAGFVIQFRDALVALYRDDDGDLIITTYIGNGQTVVCHTNGAISAEGLPKMQAQTKSIWKAVGKGVVLGLLILFVMFSMARCGKAAAENSLEQAQAANADALAQYSGKRRYKYRKYRGYRKVREARPEAAEIVPLPAPRPEEIEPVPLAPKPVWGEVEITRAVGLAFIRMQEQAFNDGNPEPLPPAVEPEPPPKPTPPVVLGDKPKWAGWIFGIAGACLVLWTILMFAFGNGGRHEF